MNEIKGEIPDYKDNRSAQEYKVGTTVRDIDSAGNHIENAWQKCPICEGTGSTPFFKECDVCKGKRIISTLTGKPPSDD